MVFWGICVTAGWIMLSGLYASYNLDEILALKPNEWGDFIAGLTAPLAFLWLVIGYFQQGKELQLNREALILQAEEFKNSVLQQEQLVIATREDIELTKAEAARKIESERRLAQPIVSVVRANKILSINGSYITIAFCNYGCSVKKVLFEIVTLPEYVKWDESHDRCYEKWQEDHEIVIRIFISDLLKERLDIIGIDMEYIDGSGEKRNLELSALISLENRVSVKVGRYYI